MARAILLGAAVLLAGCSAGEPPADPQPLANTAAAVPAAGPTPTPAATAAPAVDGFDPARVPVGTRPAGAFPFFSLLDGYVPVNRENAPGTWELENQRDAGFDRYEFFDGTKLVPVEGRLRTVEALGKGASWLEAARNYATVVKAAGGVTVFEGSGQAMVDRKLDFHDPRFRARYNMLNHERMGVYLLRTPTGEIWVEVYNAYDQKPDNYWLTIVETKALDASVRVLPAEAMKQALDTDGRVALYVGFDTDRTAIRPDSQPLLAKVVKLLERDPALRLTIEGHTDDAGTPAHNQTLSDGRARAVTGMLIAQGINPARLAARGFGQSRPVAPNTNDAGRARNRRVELVKR